MLIGSPHRHMHQEETRTPQGVHCPKACFTPLADVNTKLGMTQAHCSRMLHMLACLPLLPASTDISLLTQLGGPWTTRTRWAPQRPQGRARQTLCCHSLKGRVSRPWQLWLLGDLPLGSRSADPHSTAVWCGNLLHSSPQPHTVGCVSTLHPMEYLLLQPRSAPGDASGRVTPDLHGGLPCPLYTTVLCSAATATADCKTSLASLTWAPSIFGAAHFGR